MAFPDMYCGGAAATTHMLHLAHKLSTHRKLSTQATSLILSAVTTVTEIHAGHSNECPFNCETVFRNAISSSPEEPPQQQQPEGNEAAEQPEEKPQPEAAETAEPETR